MPGCPGYAPSGGGSTGGGGYNGNPGGGSTYVDNSRFGPIGNLGPSRLPGLHGGWGSFWAGVGYGFVSLLDLGFAAGDPQQAAVDAATTGSLGPAGGAYMGWMRHLHVATDANSIFGVGTAVSAWATMAGPGVVGALAESRAAAAAAEAGVALTRWSLCWVTLASRFLTPLKTWRGI